MGENSWVCWWAISWWPSMMNLASISQISALYHSQTLPFNVTVSRCSQPRSPSHDTITSETLTNSNCYDADEDQSFDDDRYVQLNSVCSSRTEDVCGSLQLPSMNMEFKRLFLMYIIHR